MRRLVNALMLALLVVALVAPANAQESTPAALDAGGIDLGTPTTVDEARKLQNAVQKCAELVRPAVVGLLVGQAGGSGTIITEEGLIVTAGHVSVRPNVPCQVFLADGTTVQGITLGLNRPRDYGLIKITGQDGRKFPFVKTGDSNKVVAGQWIVSMGHPLGTERQPFRPPVVRIGRVARNTPTVIVSDAPLISGDSGGPMFTLSGEIVGINVSIGPRGQDRGDNFERIMRMHATNNNTTPINLAVENLERMLAGETFNDGPSGSRDGGPSMGDYERGITDAYTVLDTEDFEAAEAAFKKVIESDPETGDGYYHLGCCYTRWAAKSEGEQREKYIQMALTSLRHGVTHGWVNLEHMGQDPDMDLVRDTPGYRSVLNLISRRMGHKAHLGLRAANVADGGGVQVTVVTDETAAAYAGLKVDDVIRQFGETTVQSLDDLRKALGGMKPGDRARVIVMRGEEEVTLELEMGGISDIAWRGDERFRSVFNEAAEGVHESTVLIRADDRIIGYGLVVGDGMILCKATPEPVVSGREVVPVDLAHAKITIETCHGDTAGARLAISNKDHDLALLRTPMKDLKPVTFGDESKVKIGGWLASVGIDPTPFQVGVRSLDEYMTQRVPFLGVNIDNPDAAAMRRAGLEGGCLITAVSDGTGAQEAGVQAGDVIWKAGDELVKNRDDLVRIVRSKLVGETVRFYILRNGEKIELDATLGVRPAAGRDPRSAQLGGPVNQRASAFGPVVQHDSLVHPRQTGSAIIDLDGNVIGMNIARAGRTKTWALPASVLKKIVPELIKAAIAELDKEEDF